VFDYDEQFSRDLLGYEPPQVILLHGNNLEADHLGDVLDLLRKRGYRFVTLESALNDDAYSLPNTYSANMASGWLEQWAVSRGKITRGGPEFPPEMQNSARPSPPPLANAPAPPFL